MQPIFPDSIYLKEQLGECLRLGLAEICQKKPTDPITYLAQFLYKHDENLRLRQEKIDQQYALERAQLEYEAELQRQEQLKQEIQERQREEEQRRLEEQERERERQAMERAKQDEEKRRADMEEQEKARLAELEKMPLEAKLPPVPEGEEVLDEAALQERHAAASAAAAAAADAALLATADAPEADAEAEAEPEETD